MKPSRIARRIAGECLALRARRLDRLLSRSYDDVLRPYGIRTTQLNLLVAIVRAGPVSAADLGRLLDLEKSTVSRNVRRMITRGWVRAVDSRDGTWHRLAATPAGESLLEEAFPAWKRAQERALSHLGRDVVTKLDTLIENLRQA